MILARAISLSGFAVSLVRVLILITFIVLVCERSLFAEADACVQIAGAASAVCQKDLAIALAPANLKLPQGKHRLSSGETLLPQRWYQALNQAYEKTSVGSSLINESRYDDWRLVSMRVAPCAALGKSPTHRVDEFCWPEARLVWQPILRKIILHARYMEAAADDRAIHAIYPVNPALFLSSDDAKKALTYLAKIAEYKVNEAISGAAYRPLNPQELAEFSRLRNSVTQQFLADTMKIRLAGVDAASYKRHGLRPEFFLSEMQQERFIVNLTVFLDRYAEPEALAQLTSFSLPEGREPAHIDEWIFISFIGRKGHIVQEKIPLHSFRDGRLLFADELHQRATMSREDEAFYEFPWDNDDWVDIYQSVILTIPDIARLGSVLADRKQRLVANTTCASCHKLNDLRFDFHNFSYLEDRDITISPRVLRDVELDLLWIKENL